MSRLRRLETTGKIFFVTCNLHERVPPLSAPERILLLTVINQSRQRLGFRVLAFVIMPNHWHALILPAPDQTISTVMHAIKRNAALRLNRQRGTTGQFWQSRFFDRFLRRVRDCREAIDYIHGNPVRDGFVAEARAWPWSSFAQFAGGTRSPLLVDRLELPLDQTHRL